MERKGKLLVVDDEEIVLKSVGKSLTREKHTVDTAISADVALQKVRTGTYDVVITDWKMPGIDGLELIARIKDIQPDAEIIMMTGYSSVESAVKAMSLGAFDYISKPFTPDDIAQAVDKALKEKKTVEAVTPKADIPSFVRNLMTEATVIGPKRKGNNFVFDIIQDPREISLDYTSTILPPKKFFLPQYETLLEFSRKEQKVSAPDLKPQKKVFFGIHPCDMQAILKLDYAFTKGNCEANYMARRENSLFIGVSCRPDRNCFCEGVGSYITNEGFDLFFVDIGDKYYIETITQAGKELLWKHANISPPSGDDRKSALQTKERNRKFQMPLGCHRLALPELLEISSDDDLWVDISKKCTSCGSCTIVCPTCYCFDVSDFLNLDLERGTRVRRWDSCQLENFAVVGTGENFRKDRKQRLRHRLNRKYLYETDEYGKPSCVGCGRCIRACVAGIDIREAVNTLAERHAEQLQGYLEYAIAPGGTKR
jgi:sulfhydrogenase subunit beta (sulfur reductase)